MARSWSSQGSPVGERGDRGDDAEVADAPPGVGREPVDHRGHARATAVTTAAHFRPARFQALLADSTLTATSAAPGTVSSGVNVAPGSTSGPWISSLTMVTP